MPITTTLLPPIIDSTITAFRANVDNAAYELSFYLPSTSIINKVELKVKTNVGSDNETVTTAEYTGVIYEDTMPTITSTEFLNNIKYCVSLTQTMLGAFNKNKSFDVSIAITDGVNWSAHSETIRIYPVWLGGDDEDDTSIIDIMSGKPSPREEKYDFQAVMIKDNAEIDYLTWYKCVLYTSHKESILYSSTTLYPKTMDMIEFAFDNTTYSFQNQHGTAYELTILYGTKKGFISDYTYGFEVDTDSRTELNNLTTAQPHAVINQETGTIEIGVKSITNTLASAINGKMVVERSSARDNYLNWIVLHEKDWTVGAGVALNYIYLDRTAESGIGYKYRLYFEENTTHAVTNLNPSNVVYSMLEDIFLTTADRQLRISFNPDITNMKYTVGDVITQTLGAQYPFARRNGHMKYRQFNISGLISIESERIENQLIYDSRSNGVVNTSSHFGTMFLTESEVNTLLHNTNASSLDQQLMAERFFRDKVIEFLYANDVKLFRSAPEGNIFVKLTNVSLTPNKTLGRHIYSFTAQATEIEEASLANYKAHRLLETGEEITSQYYNIYYISGEMLDDYFAINENSIADNALIIEQASIAF